MGATTSYGTWANHAKALSVETTVADYIDGGGAEWVARVHATGAFDRLVDDFRTAVNDQLPDGVTLVGDEFYGPVDPPGDTIYDQIRQAIDAFDLATAVKHHDPDAETD